MGVMARIAVLVLAAALTGSAPFQCSSQPDPDNALEETPGEALYRLAEQFRKDGDTKAWRTTLRYLVAQYPSSRFAERARADLEQTDAAPPTPSDGSTEHASATRAADQR